MGLPVAPGAPGVVGYPDDAAGGPGDSVPVFFMFLPQYFQEVRLAVGYLSLNLHIITRE